MKGYTPEQMPVLSTRPTSAGSAAADAASGTPPQSSDPQRVRSPDPARSGRPVLVPRMLVM